MLYPALQERARAAKVRKVRVKGKGKGKRDSSRESLDASKVKGICHMCVRNGKCSSDNCPYSHLSQDQVKRALGQGRYGKREQSRGSDENDKGSRGRGKGRGKKARAKARKDPEASKDGVHIILRVDARRVFHVHCLTWMRRA